MKFTLDWSGTTPVLREGSITDAGITDTVVIGSESDLGAVPASVLVQLYNMANPERTITKFQNRAVAHRRVYPLLATLLPASTKAPKRQRRVDADANLKPGRRGSMAGKTIHILVERYPGRTDTLRSKGWSHVKEGQTFEEYLAAGGSRSLLKWYVLKGMVALQNDLAVSHEQ